MGRKEEDMRGKVQKSTKECERERNTKSEQVIHYVMGRKKV